MYNKYDLDIYNTAIACDNGADILAVTQDQLRIKCGFHKLNPII